MEIGLAGFADLDAGRGVAVDGAVMDRDGTGDRSQEPRVAAGIADFDDDGAAVLLANGVKAVAIGCADIV